MGLEEMKNMNDDLKKENELLTKNLDAVITTNEQSDYDKCIGENELAKEAIQKELKPSKSTASTMSRRSEKKLDLNGFIGFVLLIIFVFVDLGMMIIDWIGSLRRMDAKANVKCINFDLDIEKKEVVNKRKVFYD